MTQRLNKKLAKIIELKRLKNKIEKNLHAIKKEIQEKKTALKSLRIKLKKEEIDVQKLEKLSLIFLYYSMLGSREGKLKKEKKELLFAQIKYQQNKSQIEILDKRKTDLLRQLKGLENVDNDYQALLSEKEKFILQSNKKNAKELLEISELLAYLNIEEKELNEAIAAGKNVLSDLEKILKSLENAVNWGIWDVIGGGMISSMIKHSYIDDAQNVINNIQLHISQFKRELADVQKNIEVKINISAFEAFGDFLFDGLIFDLIVQSKIEETLNQSKIAQNKIKQAIQQLETLTKRTQEKLNNLEEKRALLIKKA